MSLQLTPAQKSIAFSPADKKIFLHGSFSTGKTTCGVARLGFLLQSGFAADSILILAPQRNLLKPYLNGIRFNEDHRGAIVEGSTFAMLARRMCELFWPVVAESAGFLHPELPPRFLTMETAQYFMAKIVEPLMESDGFFQVATIHRNRLFSQILDNLNKSALVGFPHSEIGARLDEAWIGDISQRKMYTETQECATRFRTYCLEHNLLDISLQIEIFNKHIWKEPICKNYLLKRTHHVIVDNIEEDTPVAHDWLLDILSNMESALIIYDDNGGYRQFLAADPISASRIQSGCDEVHEFKSIFQIPLSMQKLSSQFSDAVVGTLKKTELGSDLPLFFQSFRYYPELIDWIAKSIEMLICGGTNPGEIVVLSPYLGDSLRFSIESRLENFGVPYFSHRPSRALRDENASKSLLVLARLAHPEWKLQPNPFELNQTLSFLIEGLDYIRAGILAKESYRQTGRFIRLIPFSEIPTSIQTRITFPSGEKYEKLQEWIETYQNGERLELDFFLGKLFGEVLTQPGYVFHREISSGVVAANLIESIRKFRWMIDAQSEQDRLSFGDEYVKMVKDGVLAAQYLRNWESSNEDRVLIAPANTFIMSNRQVKVQFWLNPGGHGWWERLYQPLTHPFVLSRNWVREKAWTDADEFRTNQENLRRLVLGLLQRCTDRVIIGITQYGEYGYEERGPLLRAINKILRQYSGSNSQGI